MNRYTGKPIIIGIAGGTASGKSTVADYLKHIGEQTQIFATRDVLVKAALGRNLPTDKASLQNLFATLTVETGDEAVLMKRLEPDVVSCTAQIVVIEECRRLSDLTGLKRLCLVTGRKLVLLYLDVPQTLRFGRFNARALERDEPQMTEAEFKQGGSSKSERELEALKEAFRDSGGLIINNSWIPISRLERIVDNQLQNSLATS